MFAGNERFGCGDSGSGAGGHGGPKIRLSPSWGAAGGCLCANGTTGTRGSTFRGSHADFDDAGDAVQLCEFSEDGEPAQRVARVGAEVTGEEADAAAVHAEAGAAVVPQGQRAPEGIG